MDTLFNSKLLTSPDFIHNWLLKLVFPGFTEEFPDKKSYLFET